MEVIKLREIGKMNKKSLEGCIQNNARGAKAEAEYIKSLPKCINSIGEYKQKLKNEIDKIKWKPCERKNEIKLQWNGKETILMEVIPLISKFIRNQKV